MAASTPLTKEAIEDALERTPRRAASDGSIRGLLDRRGIEATRGEIRELCAELVASGTIEVVGRKGDGRRYRLAGGE